MLALLAACGREQPSAGKSPAPAKFPVTLTTPAGPVTIAKAPHRIVSLSPTATEMLYAIHAGGLVVAVDDQSNYPSEAPKTKLSGFQPNTEAIATYKPDLVVYSGDSKKLAPALKAIGIATIEQPAAVTLADSYTQIGQLGAATDHVSDARELIASMRADVRGIVADARKFSQPPTFYHELDQTYFTATSKSFIGQLYALLGLRNIADAADKAGTGYPQLSAEYIVKANPDFVFLADTKCCKQSAATVAKRPGWSNVAAVKDSNVVALDDDIASRWGPRVVDFLRTISKVLHDAKIGAR
jgi:iron complex transport system substrate-binding protein